MNYYISKIADRKRFFLLMMCLIHLSFQINAQDKSIKGIVNDNLGEPLPGVTILIKGTTQGTTTGFSGTFILSGLKDTDTIVVSSMGFESQEFLVGAGIGDYNITLLESLEVLSEVVIVGYGVQKKENLTGSVGVISPEKDAGNQAVPNTESLLQGRVAGVQLTQSGGKPGAGASITIRGTGTLNNSNPLVLIDGVPGSMQDILPSDIASISVLKDAASASIYGTRAANGVILVTTKTGNKDGKLKVKYNGYAGLQKATVLPKFLDSWDFMMLKNEANVNAGRSPIYSDDHIAKAISGEDPYRFGNTDWAEQTFKDGAFFQNHQLSVSNSKDGLMYLASIGYLDQKGIMYGTDAERINYRLNFKSQLGRKIALGVNVFGAIKSSNEAADTDDQGIMRLIANASPLVPVFNENGSWGSASGVIGEINTKNSVFYATEAGRRTNTANKSTINPYLEFEPIENLKIKSNLSYSYTEGLSKIQKYKFQLTDNNGDPTNVAREQNSLVDETNTYVTTQWENTINYSKEFRYHNFNFLVGNTLNSYEHRFSSIKVTDLPSDKLTQVGSGTNPIVRGTFYDSKLLSFFGRVQYNFKEKYFVEANVRTDGSSRFPSSNRFAVFPAISGGWIFTNEPFLESVKRVLTFGKIRANWGQLGNDRIGYYPYSQTYSPTNGYPFDGASISQGGMAVTELANPDLKWETTTSYGVGFDFGLWNDKLTLTGDYFVKDTDDILLRLPIPAISGIVNPAYQNAGQVRNEGWELAVNHMNNIGEDGFSYNIGFNVTQIQNEIISMRGEKQISTYGPTVNMEGHPINSFFGYRSIGVYKTQEDLEKYPYIDGPAPGLGDLIYEDIDNNGVIDDDDRTVIGNPHPEFTYGINLGMSYKGFDFKVFFQGVQNVSIYSSNTGYHAGAQNNLMNWTGDWMNRWTPENPNTDMPRLGMVNNEKNSSFWIQDASYLRLKNIEIGYSFNRSVLKRLKMDQLRLYANSTNLFTISNIKDWDPERYAAQSRNEAYPQTTTVTFGANLTF